MKLCHLRIAGLLLAAGLASCNNSATTTTTTQKSTDTAAGRRTDTAATGALELIYSDSTYQLTGIAVSPEGKLYVNYPRWSGVYKNAMVMATGPATSAPYPDSAMNNWEPGKPGMDKWVCVQSSTFDDKGTLWVIDPAAPMLRTIQGHGCKLVKMDAASGKILHTYDLNGAVTDTSYANDVRVDATQSWAYITDSKTGGIIVVDLQAGKCREVLKGRPSAISDPAFHFIIDGRELTKEGKVAKFNSDGIALTPDGTYLYYKPLSDDKLYRIKTEYLQNWNMGSLGIGNQVEDLGHFTCSDGMIFDKSGNLYLGDPRNYRIIRLNPTTKAMTTLVEDKRLLWPDSYAISGGYLYVSCSQIENQPEYNNGVSKRTSPYAVYRVKL